MEEDRSYGRDSSRPASRSIKERGRDESRPYEGLSPGRMETLGLQDHYQMQSGK